MLPEAEFLYTFETETKGLKSMGRKRKTTRIACGILLLLLAAGLTAGCSPTHNLCPAYGSKYKVEPLPY